MRQSPRDTSRETEVESLKSIARGAGIVFTGIVLSKAFTYLYRIFVARYYGPGDYGLFTLAMAVAGVFGIIAMAGLTIGVQRYIAYHIVKKDDRRVKGVITSSLKIVLPLSCVSALFMIIISPYLASEIFHAPEMTEALVIFALSVPFSAMFLLLSAVFLGLKKVEYQVYVENIFVNGSKLALITFFGILGYGLLGLSWAWVLSSMLTCMFAFYLIERAFPIFRTKITSISMKRELLVYSLPLMFSGFMNLVIVYVDTFILGYLTTPFDVGIYNAALPTSQLLILIPMAVTALFLPVITGLHAKGMKKELGKVYKTVGRWIFYANFPMCLLIMFFPGPILNVMFGDVYAAGSSSMVVLAIGFYAFNAFALTSYHILNMLKRTKLIMHLTAMRLGLDVALNFVLIPMYGILGAAIATTSTHLFWTFILPVYSYRHLRTGPFSMGMLKSFAAGMISIAIVWFLASSFGSLPIYTLAGLFILFLALYVLLLVLFRGLERDDIEILKVVEEKSGVNLGPLRRLMKKIV